MFSGSLAVAPTVCSAIARTSEFTPCLLRGVIVFQYPSNMVAARVDHTLLLDLFCLTVKRSFYCFLSSTTQRILAQFLLSG